MLSISTDNRYFGRNFENFVPWLELIKLFVSSKKYIYSILYISFKEFSNFSRWIFNQNFHEKFSDIFVKSNYGYFRNYRNHHP